MSILKKKIHSTLFLPVCFLLMMLLVTCKKKDDLCKNANCMNNGTCADGKCNCPEGYNGSQCENYDPCYNSTCMNGGTCQGGSCVCPQGYTSANCSQQITPSKITITKVKVVKFPASNWDTGDGPDIFPELWINGGTQVWSDPNTNYQNANSDQTYNFTPNPSILLTLVNSQYTFSLWDYDGPGAYQYISSVTFNPYSGTNGFPATLTLDNNSDLAFELTLSYTW